MTFDELLQENYKMVGVNYRPTLELTEQQLNEIQQIFLDEGIGRAIARVIGATTGSFIGSNLVSAAGGAFGGAVGILIANIGLVFVPGVTLVGGMGVGIGVGTIAGALYGIYIGGKLGYRAVKKVQKIDTTVISAKIVDNINKRDDLLTKIANSAVDGKEDTASIKKIEQLTKEQEKFGNELRSAVRKDKADEKVTDEEAAKFLKLAKVAAQGKLTYIKTK